MPVKLQGLDLGPACGQCGGMMQHGLVLHVLELRQQHRVRVVVRTLLEEFNDDAL